MRNSHRRLSGTAITSCVRDITSANKAPATHAAQHAKGGADPITPESIGAAPGGYGFGERPKKIDDPDRLSGTVDGVYHFASEDHPIEGIASGLLIHYQGNFLTVSSFCRQILYAGIGSYSRLERIYANGWKPWEWVNPPMLPGVEYRTTERYLGKPVYVKTVDFGALPNASYKFVGIENGASIIRVSALASNGKTLPGSIGASQREQVLCMGSSNSVEIITYADASSLTATVTAWYTKTVN